MTNKPPATRQTAKTEGDSIASEAKPKARSKPRSKPKPKMAAKSDVKPSSARGSAKASPSRASSGRSARASDPASTSTETKAKRKDQAPASGGFEAAWERAVEAAAKRRASQPDADVTTVYKQLLRDKCLRAGTLGAATSVAGLIPGLSTLASFAIDGIGDAAYTAEMQHDLALTTFALYGREPDEKERLRILSWIGTFGAGGSELIEQVGKMVARQLAKNFAGKLIRRGLPFAEIAYSTATHLAGTYFVGRRAQLYCIGLSDAESEILLESEKGVKLQVRRMKLLAQESVEAMEQRFGMPGRTLGILFRTLTGTTKD